MAEELRAALLLCRLSILCLSLAAVLLTVLNREDGFFPVNIFGSAEPIYVRSTAEFKQITGLKFFVGAMAAAAGYTIAQLAVNIRALVVPSASIVGTKSKIRAWVSFAGDMAISHLIFSAASVAAEIAYLAKRGAARVTWNRLCTAFSHYCVVFAFAMLSSFVAALAAIAVAAISGYHLFRLYGLEHNPN